MLPTLKELGKDAHSNFCHAADLNFKIWFLSSTQKMVVLLLLFGFLLVCLFLLLNRILRVALPS